MGKKEQKLNPGDVFGMLTVVARDDVKSREKGKPYYLCQCSCGSPVISVRKSHLLSKTDPTLSCGCTKKTFTSIFDKTPELCKYWDYKKMERKLQRMSVSDQSTMHIGFAQMAIATDV